MRKTSPFFDLCFLRTKTKERAKKEVILVVSGEGATEENATVNALCRALEQAVGTFVSADVEPWRIAPVKKMSEVPFGAVAKYKILLSSRSTEGKADVIVKVIVSLGKLASYAKKKGLKSELVGSTVGFYYRLFELNKKNEEQILKHLCAQLKELSPYIYSYELEHGEPVEDAQDARFFQVPLKVTYKANERTKAFGDLLRDTLVELGMSAEQAMIYGRQGFEVQQYDLICLPKGEKSTTYHYYYSEELSREFEGTLINSYFNYVILDNLSGEYSMGSICVNRGQKYIVAGKKSAMQWMPFMEMPTALLPRMTAHGKESVRSNAYGCRPNYSKNLTISNFDYKPGKEIYQTNSISFRVPVEVYRRTKNIEIVPLKTCRIAVMMPDDTPYCFVQRDAYLSHFELLNIENATYIPGAYPQSDGEEKKPAKPKNEQRQS